MLTGITLTFFDVLRIYCCHVGVIETLRVPQAVPGFNCSINCGIIRDVQPEKMLGVFGFGRGFY